MRISEIYSSIQGETQYAGLPCTFVRTTGCDLRCAYCDSTHAFQGGKTLSVTDVLSEVCRLGNSFVLLTGGEPMLQQDLPELATVLLANKYMVSIETSGAHPLDTLPKDVIRIVDIKTPASGVSARMNRCAITGLLPRDAIKFVLADRADYEWAKRRILEPDFPKGPEILFSPIFGQLSPDILVNWVLHDRLKVRLNLQLHKYIWGPDTKGV